MNKYEKSLEDIKYFIDKTKVYKKLQKYNLTSTIDNLQELVDLTKKENQSNLLDKQIPKRPIIDDEDDEEWESAYYCPVCNWYVGEENEEQKYCINCGQRIDWSVCDE
jgi:hypothetical protein